MKVQPNSYQNVSGRRAHTDGPGRPTDPIRPGRGGAGKVRHGIRPDDSQKTQTTTPQQGPELLERIEVGNRVGTFLMANVERLSERFLESGNYSASQEREIAGLIAGFKDGVGSLLEAYSRGEIDRDAVKQGVMEAFGGMNAGIRESIGGDAGAGGLSELHHGLDGVDVSA